MRNKQGVTNVLNAYIKQVMMERSKAGIFSFSGVCISLTQYIGFPLRLIYMKGSKRAKISQIP